MFTRAKPLLLCLLSAVCLSSHGQGIPVVDAAHVQQTILIYGEHVKQLVQLMEQVKTAQNQLEEAKKAHAAITGARFMSTLADTAAVRQILPPGFIAAVDSMRSLGAGGASPDAKRIYEAVKRFGCDEQHKTNMDMRRSCEASAYMTPTTLSLLQDSISRAQGRAEKLASMVSSIDTSDVKAAADLQNRISLESAMLANEKILMDMALQNQQAQKELLAQQQKEMGLKKLTGRANPGLLFK